MIHSACEENLYCFTCSHFSTVNDKSAACPFIVQKVLVSGKNSLVQVKSTTDSQSTKIPYCTYTVPPDTKHTSKLSSPKDHH